MFFARLRLINPLETLQTGIISDVKSLSKWQNLKYESI